MSNPHPQPGRRLPRRAEPLQPDKLGGGAVESETKKSGPELDRKTADDQAEQSKTALDNVREGY